MTFYRARYHFAGSDGHGALQASREAAEADVAAIRDHYLGYARVWVEEVERPAWVEEVEQPEEVANAFRP